MDTLNIAENLVRLRHEKGITQEELARFVGVTKASISKWETKQTYPDLLLLPKLASYFDISVDGLLGYDPQLSKEQIRTYYHQLAADFAEKPFEEVMIRSEELVKKYYSCYPFLLQICVLWLNHHMLAEENGRRSEIQQQIIDLCTHIIEGCDDINICNDAVSIQALTELQRGNAQEVIEALEERSDPRHISRTGSFLVQAYMMRGEVKRAEEVLQVDLYRDVMEIISECTGLLKIYGNDWERFSQILNRADGIMELFEIGTLNPNTAASYQFLAAVLLCGFQREEEAAVRLGRCVQSLKRLIKGEIMLHGDSFFDRVDTWFEELDLGTAGVRNLRLVMESAVQMLDHPAFAVLPDQKQLQHWKQELEEMKNAYDTKSDKNV